jgi:ATPases of the AAA+ class
VPKIDDVAYLVQMIGNKNYTRARETVEKMIESERQSGRERGAKQLEVSLRNWTNEKLVELPQNIQPLVWSEEPMFSLDKLYLNEDVRNEVQSFIKERASLEKLRDAGLNVRNRILLAGPPGNGKTSLAEALAKEFELPFLSIKLHETIDGHLGETSSRLGKIFEYAQFNNCLIFLDELDCIGGQRISGAKNADREFNSIVNTLLTNLDRLPDESIIMGATNMPESIDGALERRFNLKLWLDTPNAEQIELFISDYQQKYEVTFSNTSIDLSGKPPWSRVAEFCESEHRKLILGDKTNSNFNEWIGRGNQ